MCISEIVHRKCKNNFLIYKLFFYKNIPSSSPGINNKIMIEKSGKPIKQQHKEELTK